VLFKPGQFSKTPVSALSNSFSVFRDQDQQDQQDQHPIFTEAACCLVDHRGTPTLAAAVVAAASSTETAATARRALAQRLPAVAVPGKVLLLDEMPRLPGGFLWDEPAKGQTHGMFMGF
jgi:hypothetical protein